jgi:uncharacterized protein YbjT (DUF2867 family)
VIHAFGHPDPPVPRLMKALEARGHEVASGGPRAAEDPGRQGEPATLVLGAGTGLDPLSMGVLLGAWARTSRARVLILGAQGTHRDATVPRLRRLWDLEETVRAATLPVLTLRLGPLLGSQSPLWLRLRSRPRLAALRDVMLQPVLEEDVVESIVRALEGRAAWEGWYEVVGTEVLTVRELAELASQAGGGLPFGTGAWEPPLEELRALRLGEPEPWLRHFGLVPRNVAGEVAQWAA